MEKQQQNNAFFEWLSSHVTAAQYKKLQTVYTYLNDFCLSKRLIKCRLLDCKDIPSLCKARTALISNRLYRFYNRGKTDDMVFFLACYEDYLQQLQKGLIPTAQAVKNRTVSETQQAVSAVSPLRETAEETQAAVQKDAAASDEITQPSATERFQAVLLDSGANAESVQDAVFALELADPAVKNRTVSEAQQAVSAVSPLRETAEETQTAVQTDAAASDEITQPSATERFQAVLLDSGANAEAVQDALFSLELAEELAEKNQLASTAITAAKNYREVMRTYSELLLCPEYSTRNRACGGLLTNTLNRFVSMIRAEEKQSKENAQKATEAQDAANALQAQAPEVQPPEAQPQQPEITIAAPSREEPPTQEAQDATPAPQAQPPEAQALEAQPLEAQPLEAQPTEAQAPEAQPQQP